MSIRKNDSKKKMTKAQARKWMLASMFLLVFALIGFNIYMFGSLRPALEKQKKEAAAQQAEQMKNETASYGEAAIGGEFTLTNHLGETVTNESLKGTHRLVFFGFTHCPDICPVSLLTMTNVMEKLGDKASAVQPVFITVDPKRDTQEKLKEYLANFHPSFIGLTGTKAQIDEAAKAYKVYYQTHTVTEGEAQSAKDKGEEAHPPGHVIVDHSGFIYLLDKEGTYLAHFSHDESEQTMLDAITPHLE